MKGKISKIKNMEDELVLPVTTAEAVYSEDGKTLNDEIKNINSSLDKKVYYCDNVEKMKNGNFKTGDTVITLGYWGINDGGGGSYKITDNTSLIDDGGYIHSLNNGLKALLISNNGEINVKQYGVKTGSNSSVDCSDIINKIINDGRYTILYFPKGEYYFKSTINISQYIKIRGELDSKTIATYIKTASIEAFTSNEKEVRFHLENIEFQSDNNNFSILFSRVKFTDSIISNIRTRSYHVILNGSMYQISKIRDCNFFTIRYAGFTNTLPSEYSSYSASTLNITDSEIGNNYFTGSHSEKCFLFYQVYLNTTRIHNNYIDFFYNVFATDYTNESQTVMFQSSLITNNIIEYCIGILRNVRLCDVIITNNLFRYVRKAEASRFSYLTTDEVNNEWIAFNSPRMAKSIMFNNSISHVDVFLNFNVLGKDVQVGGNLYDGTPTKVVFNNTNGWASEGVLCASKIEELELINYDVLPVLKNTSVNTYPGQTILYNNKLLRNINHKWYDCIGNICE